MTDKIRVGIVGATVTQGGSGWGANAHVPALKALPGYELKAVCTSHEDTAKASAAAFGVERAFHRFSDMAADPDIDLLVVCVRVPGHRDLVMAGLEAGKAVLCSGRSAPVAEAERWPGSPAAPLTMSACRAQRPSDSARGPRQSYIGGAHPTDPAAQAQLQRGRPHLARRARHSANR
jgi:hypothetical protein